MKTKLHGLDHLRALAITMVFVYHYSRLFPHPGWMENAGKFGWTGVDLFFVLSGYLIASQLFQSIAKSGTISLKEFVLKRAFRIIPAYLFIVALYFLFPLLHEREALAPLWKYLTFTQNVGLDIKKQGTFSHAWSLCIEEQFYLLFPLVLLILLRFKLFKQSAFLLALLFILSFLVRLYSWCFLVSPFASANDFAVIWYKWIYYPPWCRTDGLIFGVGIAALAQFKPALTAKIQKQGNLVLLLSLLVLIAAYFLCFDAETFGASVFGFPLVDMGYALLVLAAISPLCFLYRFNSKITVFIATLSYGIYLSHKIVIHVMQNRFTALAANTNLMFLLCIIACVLVAFAMNKVIEKPFLKLRNKVMAK